MVNICLHYRLVGEVPPVRLERTHLAPEASALSSELRGQIFPARSLYHGPPIRARKPEGDRGLWYTPTMQLDRDYRPRRRGGWLGKLWPLLILFVVAVVLYETQPNWLCLLYTSPSPRD